MSYEPSPGEVTQFETATLTPYFVARVVTSLLGSNAHRTLKRQPFGSLGGRSRKTGSMWTRANTSS